MCKEEINIVIILTHNTKIPSFDWPRFWLLSIWAGTEYWRIQKHRAQTKNEHDVLEHVIRRRLSVWRDWATIIDWYPHWKPWWSCKVPLVPVRSRKVKTFLDPDNNNKNCEKTPGKKQRNGWIFTIMNMGNPVSTSMTTTVLLFMMHRSNYEEYINFVRVIFLKQKDKKLKRKDADP